MSSRSMEPLRSRLARMASLILESWLSFSESLMKLELAAASITLNQ